MKYRKAGQIVEILLVVPVLLSVVIDVRSREITDMAGRRVTHR